MKILTVITLICLSGCFNDRSDEINKASNKLSKAYQSFQRGNEFLSKEMYVDAEKAFDEALALRPNWEEARYNKELASKGIRQIITLKTGEEYYQEAIKNNKSDDSLKVQFVYYLIRKNKFIQADEIANMILEEKIRNATIEHLNSVRKIRQ